MLKVAAFLCLLSFTCGYYRETVDSSLSALEMASQVQMKAAPKRRAGVRGDLTITGTMVCSGLASPTGNVTLLGDLCNVGSGSVFTATSVITSHLKVRQMKAEKVYTQKGTVAVKGKIQVSGAVAGLMNSTCENLVGPAGAAQYAMVALETFESTSEGWDKPATSECNGNTILGGHCNLAGGEVSKTFTNLPAHDKLRLSASFLFLDGWAGENAYAKVGDSFIWLDNHDATGKKGLDVCGAKTPETKLSSPIDAVVPHKGDSVKVTFGSTLKGDACQKSFGVDNVMLQVA